MLLPKRNQTVIFMQHCTIFVRNPRLTSVMQICFMVYFFICQRQFRNLTRQMCQAEAAGALPPCKRWLNQPSYSHSLMSTLPHNTHLWHLLCMNVRPRAEQQNSSLPPPRYDSGACVFAPSQEAFYSIMLMFGLIRCGLVFSFYLRRLEVDSLWPDRTQTVINRRLKPKSWFGCPCWHLYGRGVCIRARVWALRSNCVGSMLPTEHSAVWVMRCSSIGSHVLPPALVWMLRAQLFISLALHQPEPAESGALTAPSPQPLASFSTVPSIFTLVVKHPPPYKAYGNFTFMTDNCNFCLPAKWCLLHSTACPNLIRWFRHTWICHLFSMKHLLTVGLLHVLTYKVYRKPASGVEYNRLLY